METVNYLTVADALKEVRTYFSLNDILDHDSVINFVHPYFDLIAKEDYTLFKDEVIIIIQNEYANLFVYPSDIIRIKRELEKIARLHGQIRPWLNVNGSYELTTLVKSPKVTRPIVRKPDTVKMTDEFTCEIVYKKDEKTALLENSIDEYLEPFKNTAIDNKNYSEVTAALKLFFEGHPPTKPKCCTVRNRNKKKLGYALGQLYRGQANSSLSFEYLDFCRRLFDCYKDEKIDKKCLNKSNLHKYFTTKTQ